MSPVTVQWYNYKTILLSQVSLMTAVYPILLIMTIGGYGARAGQEYPSSLNQPASHAKRVAVKQEGKKILELWRPEQ